MDSSTCDLQFSTSSNYKSVIAIFLGIANKLFTITGPESIYHMIMQFKMGTDLDKR